MMNMTTIKVAEDISTLSTIPEKAINKLVDLAYLSIADGLVEIRSTNESEISYDIGIGTLTVILTDNSVRYRFTPSAKLNEVVKDTVVLGKNLLSSEVEKSIVDKFTNIYKELV